MAQAYNKKAREGNSLAGFRHSCHRLYFVTLGVIRYTHEHKKAAGVAILGGLFAVSPHEILFFW